MDLQDILSEIERSGETIASTLCEMISIPAVSPAISGEGEEKRADYLMSLLDGFDSVRRIDVPDPDFPGVKRSNILAVKKGKLPGTVWIISHIDTVPAGSLELWDTDPFKGTIKNGRVYGRGASDDGQAVVASIAAAKQFEKGTLNGMSLGLALVADEEVSNEMGICRLLEMGFFGPEDIFIVPDCGSPEGKYIEVGEKNIMWLRFDIEGKTCHASIPDVGLNAFEVGCRLLARVTDGLRKKFPSVDQTFMPPVSTFAPTRCVETVKNVNTVPGIWSFWIDSRFILKYTHKEVLTAAREIASEVSKETGAEISVSSDMEHVSGGISSLETPAYRALSDAVEMVTGNKPTAAGVGGGTCANFFRLKGYDAYAWQTESGPIHAPNEYVDINILVNDTKVFAALFYDLCAVGRSVE